MIFKNTVMLQSDAEIEKATTRRHFMKEYFMPYYNACNKVKELTEELEEHENKMYFASGINYGKIPNERSIEDRTLRLVNQKDIIVNKLNEAIELKEKLEEKYINDIEVVDDARLKSILRSFFIYDMKCYQIAKMLDVTEKHVYKLRRQAIAQFKEKHGI